MLTFETYAQYLAACTEQTTNSHRPPAAPYFWTCETCGKCCPHSDSYGVRRGANGAPDSMHCYACCYAADVEELHDRTGPFCAYVSGDRRQVHNWPGGELGDVFEYAEHRTGWYGSIQARFRVRDVHGKWWTGRGAGAGMFCTLWPMKTPSNWKVR